MFRDAAHLLVDRHPTEQADLLGVYIASGLLKQVQQDLFSYFI
jgi:hypothetical protein